MPECANVIATGNKTAEKCQGCTQNTVGYELIAKQQKTASAAVITITSKHNS